MKVGTSVGRMVGKSRVLATLPLLLAAACGSSASSSDAGAPMQAGGATFNLPIAACPDASVTATGDAGACVSLQTRSFSQDVAPLFGSCGGEICHDFGGGKIATQIGVPSSECCSALEMIAPGHPERSYVLRKLRGEKLCAGSQMPLDNTPFSAAEIQTVADWICQGADTAH